MNSSPPTHWTALRAAGRGVCCGILLLAWVLPATAADSTVLPVLSSDLKPYQEAFQGLQEVLGQQLTPVYLPARTLKTTGILQTIVAFGGEAATQSYPSNDLLIYCMAPGTYLNPAVRKGPTIQISLMPSPQATLSKIKAIQPDLRRVAVLWASNTYTDYLKDFSEAAAGLSIQVELKHVKDPGALPEVIRELPGRVDAVWLMADPPLINSESLLLLKEFSWSNKIPLYSPIEGLAGRGALASIYTSYRQIGRNAGEAIQQATHQSQILYPSEVRITLNAAAADQIGLSVNEAVRREAESIIQ